MRLFSWLREQMTARPRTRRPPAARPSPLFRPRLEALERRDVLSFGSPVAYAASQPLAVVSADVNGDGKPDLISLTGNGQTVSVQLNNGNGTFGAARTFFDPGHSASAMAVGDVTGDGKLDIVLANKGGGDSAYPGGSITVLLGDGHGGFTPADNGMAQYFSTPFTSIALADLFGDGKMDLVAIPANGGRVYVARSEGNGIFAPAQTYSVQNSLTTPGIGAAQLSIGDFNGDGKPDIVVTDPRLNSVSVLLNNGSGGFDAAQTYTVGGRPTAVAVGDINGDGKPDIVTTNSNNTVSVLLNNGDGTFGTAQSYATGGPASSVALGDFNHDGRLDIATTGSAETDVLFNNGSGAFGPYQKVGPAGSSLVAADFNGDGYADLAEIDAARANIDVLLNKGNG